MSLLLWNNTYLFYRKTTADILIDGLPFFFLVSSYVRDLVHDTLLHDGYLLATLDIDTRGGGTASNLETLQRVPLCVIDEV